MIPHAPLHAAVFLSNICKHPVKTTAGVSTTRNTGHCHLRIAFSPWRPSFLPWPAFWRLRPSLRQPWRPRSPSSRRAWIEIAHLANSTRTRSALVSTTILSSFTAHTTPTTPPMVVILSPTFTALRICSASFFFLFSGRIMRKYMIAKTASIITIMLPIPPPAAAVVSKNKPIPIPPCFIPVHYTIPGRICKRYFQILRSRRAENSLRNWANVPPSRASRIFCISWL